MSLKSIIDDLWEHDIMGRAIANIESIELLKRSYLHCHLIITFVRDS